MNLAEFSLRQRVVVLVASAVLLFGGLSSYSSMSRLEDPEFTIKDALVVTPYPGASPTEVEEEVTDALEIAIQSLAQVKEIESRSERGLSTITVTIRDKYDKATLPQVWDELRRKVGDAAGSLPYGVGTPRVMDDYGDVFGVFVALYGSEYSYAELKESIDLLRRELLLVDDVAKIETFGERTEAIYIELDRDRMTQLGVPTSVIVDELRNKNVVADAGQVQVGTEFIALSPTGDLETIESLGALLISAGSEAQIRLRDVANVRRGYVEPPGAVLRYDGDAAIGLGISTISGGNVVTMGEKLRERVTELLPQLPLGMQFGIVSLQSEAVSQAVSGFVSSLVQAVAIVVVVLLFFMGLRSGLLIGFVLLLTIAGSFIFLDPMGVALERISLGALIIALGMLVDNAIVVVDGVLVRQQKGQDTAEAAIEVVGQSSIPLLGATFIAILAFAAIGTSQDSTGEFCRSLYQVVLVSLLLSWVTAVTVTPVLCVLFLPMPERAQTGDAAAEEEAAFYSAYRRFLSGCIRARWLTVSAVLLVFGASLYGFRFVENSFFPPSTRPQFMVDVWMPRGTHIDVTGEIASDVEGWLLEKDDVAHVTSLIGKGGLRFLLTYTPEKTDSSYVQFLVDVEPGADISGLIDAIERESVDRYPDALVYGSMFQLGPGSTGKIQARFLGPDADVLRSLAQQATGILYDQPNAKAIRTSWRERVKVIHAEIAEEAANRTGIQRTDVAKALLESFEGAQVGVYREEDLLLPIILRATERERQDVASLRSQQIWSPSAQRMIPLQQVVSDFRIEYEDELVIRRDRRRTVTVYGDPKTGPASVLFGTVRPLIEAIELPDGYTLEWGGEYEDSGNAQAALAAGIPVFMLAMVLVTIALFNSLRQPLVIWLNVPLAVIGVTVGLLTMGQPFGFMALLGFLSLTGMLIKNAIVLVDEINLQLGEGRAPFAALVESGVSRLRPVAMAALTTALGMIPLLLDAFFISMAVTIIAGLVFATVLTMVVLPVFYAIIFGVESSGEPA